MVRDKLTVGTTWLVAVACLCILGTAVSAIADQGDSPRKIEVTIVDGQGTLLSTARLAPLDSRAEVFKAVPTGDGIWTIETLPTDRKVQLFISKEEGGSITTEVALPPDPGVSLRVYLQEKTADVVVLNPSDGVTARRTTAPARAVPPPSATTLTPYSSPLGGLRQGGDTCAGAVDITGALPINVSGTTTGYTNDYDEVCTYTGSTAPDVVYVFSPAADVTVDLTLCPGMTNYDSKLYVYEDVCPAGSFYACNDDACVSGAGQSYVSEIAGLTLTGGHDYYIVVDGYGTNSGNYYLDIIDVPPPPPPPECPANTLFGQNVHGPADGWSAGTSEFDVSAANLLRAESFSGLTGPVCDVHWWGFMIYLSADWAPCIDSNPEFQIIFSQDAGGAPGAEVCNYILYPTITDTGLLYHSTYQFPLMLFEVTLPSCCAITDGWVSIQGGGDATCWFLWQSSGTGDGSSYFNNNGVVEAYAYDLSLCLTGVAATGACCDESTGICTDDVSMADCDGRFAADTLCADLDPPCAIVEPAGACCNPVEPYDCFPNKTEADCGAIGFNWQGEGTDCTPNPCTPGCEHSIVLIDSYGDGWNGGSVALYVDGGLVGNYTLASGAGPVTYYFQADTGSVITTVYTAGSWSSENEYYIYDVNGTLLCADGTGGTTPVGCTATGYCGADPCEGNQPANDDCGTATPVAGPYPQTVTGDNACAEVDCPGVLDWNATWWAIDLPYAVNDLYVDYCGTQADIWTIGIVTYDYCLDCAAYNIATSYAFVACGDGFSNPHMMWNDVPGPTTIYLPVYAVDDGGVDLAYSVTIDVIESVPPPNDFCEDAIPIGLGVTPGTTQNATTDASFPTCGTAYTPTSGVWYSVTGTGNTMTADLCNGATSYDTKLTVYCPDCVDTVCVDGNDDFCGLQSAVEWCSQPGANYLILVHGYSTATGAFELTVADLGTDCEVEVACLPMGACCLPDASCDVVTVGECDDLGGSYQGDDTNCGGLIVEEDRARDDCNEHVLGDLNAGSPVWNKVYGAYTPDPNCNALMYDGYSDGQYYNAIPIMTSVAENLVAEVLDVGTDLSDTIMTLYCNPFDPANPLDNAIAYDDDGGDGMLSAFFDSDGIYLQPATVYWLVISTYSPGYTGAYDVCLGGHFFVPGGGPGACCLGDGSCADMESDACADAGGIFGGSGTECATYNCPELVGACCLYDGGCIVTTLTCCDVGNVGRSFLGDGTDCGQAFVEVLFEDFNAGIPAGWTITDNAGAGWHWELNTTTGRTNYAGGDGTCMVADADDAWLYPYDTSLITPEFMVPDGGTLEYMAAYNFMSSVEAAEVNITIDGGANWTNLLTWMEDHSAYGPGESVVLDLSAYVGNMAQIEFRYYGDGWDWYYEVDDVAVKGFGEAINPCPQPAFLDIKPGSCPNSFNRGSHGVLPVALMSSDTVDVTLVDLSTVRIMRADGIGGMAAQNEGPPGPHSVYEDVATPFEGEGCECAELGGDGVMDLQMKFRTDQVVSALQMGDLLPGSLVELVVTGMLTDGTEFFASDCVRLVPPGSPPGMVNVESNFGGVWVDIQPLDEQLDAGGFASYSRTYPQTTVITLNAPPVANGNPFVCWRIDGAIYNVGQTTLQIPVVSNQVTIKAQYRQLFQPSPRPGLSGGSNTPIEDGAQQPQGGDM